MDNTSENSHLLSRDKSFVYLWTYRQFQQEQTEWDGVNKLLQNHGFKPLHFADPVENKNLSDLVLLDKKSAGEIRTMLRMMLTDSERRQALIQQLVQSNDQLKEEAQELMSQAARQSRRATELEALLDGVKDKVQDLEDRYLSKAAQQHSQTQQLQREKQDAQKHCQALEQKLSEQRESAAQLQRKLYFTVKEEERRLARQNPIAFQQICKTTDQRDSPADQRPAVKELKSCKHQLCRLEGSKTQNNTRFPEENDQTEIHDVEAGNIRGQVTVSCLCAQYRHLLNEIGAVLTNPRAPLRLHRPNPTSVGLELAEFQALLPTLEAWAQQLDMLRDLQRGLTKLTVRLMPWQPPDGGHNAAEAVKVDDLVLLVESMLENTADEKVLRSPTRYTLESMVSHFQKLFDVGSLSGVFPRMNEVYTRLGEMTNAMRNLRDTLGLDDRAAPSEVVNQVARLVSSTEDTAGPQLHDLLGDADINSVIVKVKQHQEFFPAFHSLVMEMLQTLGVGRLEDIVPALRSLKLSDVSGC